MTLYSRKRVESLWKEANIFSLVRDFILRTGKRMLRACQCVALPSSVQRGRRGRSEVGQGGTRWEELSIGIGGGTLVPAPPRWDEASAIKDNTDRT